VPDRVQLARRARRLIGRGLTSETLHLLDAVLLDLQAPAIDEFHALCTIAEERF